jgi:hypothetical protein
MAPPGAGYSFNSGEDADIVPIRSVESRDNSDGRLIKYGGGGAMTTMIVGCISFETAFRNPLLESLTDLIYLTQSPPWKDGDSFLGSSSILPDISTG